MKFWIVTVEDQDYTKRVFLDGAEFHVNEVPNGTLVIYQERDIPLAAKLLANRHPGHDVHILEPSEVYFVKPAAPIRKVWDKQTGDLKVV